MTRTTAVTRTARPGTERRRDVEWWGYLILVLLVVVIAVGAVFAVQALRRSGGVISLDNSEKKGGSGS